MDFRNPFIGGGSLRYIKQQSIFELQKLIFELYLPVLNSHVLELWFISTRTTAPPKPRFSNICHLQ